MNISVTIMYNRTNGWKLDEFGMGTSGIIAGSGTTSNLVPPDGKDSKMQKPLPKMVVQMIRLGYTSLENHNWIFEMIGR